MDSPKKSPDGFVGVMKNMTSGREPGAERKEMEGGREERGGGRGEAGETWTFAACCPTCLSETRWSWKRSEEVNVPLQECLGDQDG